MKTYTLPDLLDIMAKLRAPDGCPWDKKQTHESLLNYLIEESYEFIDAVENKDLPNMKEELGDVLLQVIFHAQLAKERGDFDFAGVVQVLSDKLVRRHPHVFGELRLENSEAVEKKWDELKKEEKGDKAVAEEGGLGRMPKHLPALIKAEKLQKRASQVGFDWPDYQGPMDKIREELEELRVEATAEKPDADRLESEFGDLLFAAVNVGRFFKLDPEKALARANRKFMDRYARMEQLAHSQGKAIKGMRLSEMDAFWDEAKREEKKGFGARESAESES
jgi:tetrapyrrole methylase family protein/MazG family protein